MPLYEGIGLISEKHAVVLDIGWFTTKCGYAGETSPRCIIPSRLSGQHVLGVSDPDKLYSTLVEFIHTLYFKWLLVNPKDRRVVIVENLLGSSLFKDTLAKVLFKHYEVSSLLFVPSHLVTLFTLGVNTGAKFRLKSIVLRLIYQVWCWMLGTKRPQLFQCMKEFLFLHHGRLSPWQVKLWRKLSRLI